MTRNPQDPDAEGIQILPGSEDPDFLDLPEPHLQALEARFQEAMEFHQKGKRDMCTRALKEILQAEPRLAEPRLALANLHLEEGRLDEAEEEAREALRILEQGGQWTLEVPENVLLAYACTVLAETLRLQLSEDDLIFGDAETYRALAAETRALYRRATELNPNDEDASYYRVFMGNEPAES